MSKSLKSTLQVDRFFIESIIKSKEEFLYLLEKENVSPKLL